jgi:hypothetical protein
LGQGESGAGVAGHIQADDLHRAVGACGG